RERFWVGDVDGRGTDPPFRQSPIKGGMIYDGAACHVYEDGIRTHFLELALTDKTHGLRGQWKVKRHKVRLGEQVVEGSIPNSKTFFCRRVGSAVMIQDAHVKSNRPASDLPTNPSQTDNA